MSMSTTAPFRPSCSSAIRPFLRDLLQSANVARAIGMRSVGGTSGGQLPKPSARSRTMLLADTAQAGNPAQHRERVSGPALVTKAAGERYEQGETCGGPASADGCGPPCGLPGPYRRSHAKRALVGWLPFSMR